VAYYRTVRGAGGEGADSGVESGRAGTKK